MVENKVLILGREKKTTQPVLKQLERFGYSYTVAESPHPEVVDGSLLMAVVCCSQEDIASCLEHVEYLANRRVAVLAVLNAENDYAAQLLQSKGVAEVCVMPINKRFQKAFSDIAEKHERAQQKSAMGTHFKTLGTLTPRERRVVQLASVGQPNKQIASNIGLSIKSIERIRADAYRKMNVRSTAEMTRVFLLGSLYPELGGPPNRQAL
ncbi:MAG: LuxR C-terminal-related transcriptional regulator [Planctomycetota bacterium]